MQNAVLVRVVNGARHLGDQFHRAPNWHWLALGHFIELAAFDKFHAEVTRAIALADFVNRDNAWMLETGGRFGFATKTFQMRFGGPMAQADHFQCHGAVQTFLPRAINHALTAATDFFLDFVITKVSEAFLGCRVAFFLSVRSRAIITTGVTDPGYRFVGEKTKTCL